MLYYTILPHTRLPYTILYSTLLYSTLLYYTIPYCAIVYYTVLYYLNTILYSTILYYPMLCCTTLYYTILQYYIMLYYTMLCSAMLSCTLYCTLYYTLFYGAIYYTTHYDKIWSMIKLIKRIPSHRASSADTCASEPSSHTWRASETTPQDGKLSRIQGLVFGVWGFQGFRIFGHEWCTLRGATPQMPHPKCHNLDPKISSYAVLAYLVPWRLASPY